MPRGASGGKGMAKSLRLQRVGALVCLLSSVIFVGVGSVTRAQSTPLYEIVVNIPALELHLYADGVRAKTYPIGVGRLLNPSQLGPTEIINEVIYPTYYPPDWYRSGLSPIPPGPENPVGTRWLGLGFRGYGIHGTNQPETIGTAASSGCVRMHNRDVEELASLVGIGTSVTFIYETIEVWRDAILDRAYLKVHKDIYRQGVNTIDHMRAALAEAGVTEDVDLSALGVLLGEAAGEARPVPLAVPIVVDGNVAQTTAVDYGGRLLIPLSAFSKELGLSYYVTRIGDEPSVWLAGQKVPDPFWIGSQAYVSPRSAASAVGLALRESGRAGIRFDRVLLVDDRGNMVAERTFVHEDWLRVPVQDVSARLGIQAAWDDALSALRIDGRIVFGADVMDGKVYLPHDRLGELTGVRIHWRPEQHRAVLDVPRVDIAEAGVQNAYLYEDGVYVPLRPIADYLGLTLGWHQESRTAFVRGEPVKGFVRDGRIYANLSDLAGLVTPLEYEWNEEELELRLQLHPHR